MRPRRGLPADDFNEQDSPEEEVGELEVSAVRRGIDWDDEPTPTATASRRAAADDEGADDLAEAPVAGRRATEDSAPVEVEDEAPPVPMSVVDDPDDDAEIDEIGDEPGPAAESAANVPPPAVRTGATRAPQGADPGPTPAPAPAPTTSPRPAAAEPKQSTAPRTRPPVAVRDRRRVGAALGVIAATLLATVGIGALPAEPAPVPDTVPLVTALSRTCPTAEGQVATLHAVSSEGEIGLRQVGSEDVQAMPSPLLLGDQTIASVVSPRLPQASVIGGQLISTENQLWWGACRSALADQYVQLPGGAGAQLVIINPDPEPALIDVTLSGPDGEITGDGLRGITIEANSQHVIDLAAHAGEAGALGARVRSSVGRVQAVGLLNGDQGADFASSTVQGSQVVVAAVPADASSTRLVLTNPGTGRNIVKIEAFGEAGRYELPGFESYPLNAQSSVVVDLTEVIGGLPLGLSISGRDAFAATLLTSRNDDLAIEPGQLDEQNVAAQDLVAVVPGPGVLHISNPSSSEALVVVNWGPDQAPANRTVLPGGVATIEVPAGAGLARINSTAPVAAALLLQPADRPGFAIVRLQAAARSQASMPMELDIGMGR